MTRPPTSRERATRSPLSFLGGLLALYLVGPIALFAVRCLQDGGVDFGADGLGEAVRTSLVSATLSTAIVIALGVPLARVLARSKGWMGRLVGVLVQLPLALPPVMSGIVLIYLVGPYTWLGEHFPLTDSLAGVVVAQTFVAAPFLVIAARSAFAAINPDVDDLAATMGVGALGRFWRVDLPLAMPGIVAGALLTWLRAIGEYGATSLIAYHPSTLPVYTSVQFSGDGLTGTSAPTIVALGLAAAVLVLVHLPWRRPAGAVTLPSPEPPTDATPTPVAFRVDHRVGDFHLDASYAAAGHRLAVLGPSGSGKTLLLRSLAGLIDAEHVTFGAVDVTRVPVERRRVGYVPQDRLLFEGRSVWRNVTFSPRAVPGRAAWWLRQLGLDTLADRSTCGLSGGERQRASLMQALAADNRVLLLDEPFSALDTPTRSALVAQLRALQHQVNLSSVLVTHDPREALMLADEVVLLDAGRVLQAGPVRDVFAHPCSVHAARLLGLDDVIVATCRTAGVLTIGVGLTDDAEASKSTEPSTRVEASRSSAGVPAGAGLTIEARGVVPGQTYLVYLPQVALRLDADERGIRAGAGDRSSVKPDDDSANGAVAGTRGREWPAEGAMVEVRDVIVCGTHDDVIVTLGDGPLRVTVPSGSAFTPGETAWLRVLPEAIRCWPAA